MEYLELNSSVTLLSKYANKQIRTKRPFIYVLFMTIITSPLKKSGPPGTSWLLQLVRLAKSAESYLMVRKIRSGTFQNTSRNLLDRNIVKYNLQPFFAF